MRVLSAGTWTLATASRSATTVETVSAAAACVQVLSKMLMHAGLSSAVFADVHRNEKGFFCMTWQCAALWIWLECDNPNPKLNPEFDFTLKLE